MSYVLGIFLFKEKVGWKSGVSFFLAIVGLWIVYFGDIEFGQIFPMTAAFISGGLFSIYFATTKKISSRYSPFQINTLISLFAVVINLLISFLSNEQFNINLLSVEWVANLGYGIVAFFGLYFTIIGFKKIDAHKGSLILLSEIIFGFLFGLFLFGEILNLTTILGGILILLSAALPNLPRKTENII